MIPMPQEPMKVKVVNDHTDVAVVLMLILIAFFLSDIKDRLDTVIDILGGPQVTVEEVLDARYESE